MQQHTTLSGIVYVRPTPPQRVSDGGILIPDIAIKKTNSGQIVFSSDKNTVDAYPGDWVVFFENAAFIKVTINDEDLLIVREGHIIGKLL